MESCRGPERRVDGGTLRRRRGTDRPWRHAPRHDRGIRPGRAGSGPARRPGLDILAAIRKRKSRVPGHHSDGATPSSTAWPGSTPAPTITSSNRSHSPSWWPGSARWRDAARTPNRYPSRWGPLSLDQVRRQVTLDRDSVALTVTEFEILRLLMQDQGQSRPVNRSGARCGRAWDGLHRSTTSSTSTSRGFAARSSIQPSRRLIHTIRGVGFTMRVGVPVKARIAKACQRSPRRRQSVTLGVHPPVSEHHHPVRESPSRWRVAAPSRPALDCRR